MTIATQEFYEGAAIYRLIRSGGVREIAWDNPFFVVGADILVYLKHTTRVRTPWAFTLTADERMMLKSKARSRKVMISFVCGGDGIAAVTFKDLEPLVNQKGSSHISCYRKHHQHYGISGPAGVLERKVSPSDWEYLLS